MFCSECGKECAGKFCWSCGAPLHSGAGGDANSVTAIAESIPVDWQNEVQYDKQVPAGAPISGEAIIDTMGKIMHSPLPMASAATIVNSFYSQLGIHTGKTRTEHYSRPVGRVIACAVCALAKGGYKVRDVHQATDGCVLICEIPSDILSFAGQLLVTIQREPAGASLQAAASIPGQLYDWGKSNRCLVALVDGIETFNRVFA